MPTPTFGAVNKEIEVSFSKIKTVHDFDYVHYHNCHEIYFLLSGSRKYIVDKETIPVSKYDCILIKEGILHRTFDGCGHERFLINFYDSFLNKYASRQFAQYLMQIFTVNKISIPAESFYKLKSIFKKMENEKEEQLFISFVNIVSVLLENINNPCTRHENGNDLISTVLDYIEINYRDINSLDEVSKNFHITKEHLCRLFKKNLGITFITYLNTIKVMHACEILSSTNKSITEIAFECGFNSSMYFCKVFKDIIGISPKAYKNSTL